MPSIRYSFRRSTVNAGIATERRSISRRNERESRRERTRRQVSANVVTNVSASSRVLEHPLNSVMPIAPRALANDQVVGGDQTEVTAPETAPVTALSAELEVQMPNLLEYGSASAATSLGVVGNGNQQVSASVTASSSAPGEPSSTDVGSGMKRSSQFDSHLPPMEKRRKIQRSASPRESGSEQVAESSADAIARATSASRRPAVPSVGTMPSTASDVEMMDVSGDDAVPLEVAPTSLPQPPPQHPAPSRPDSPAVPSPRAQEAAEAMLDEELPNPHPLTPSPPLSPPVVVDILDLMIAAWDRIRESRNPFESDNEDSETDSDISGPWMAGVAATPLDREPRAPQEYLDSNVPASLYYAGMLGQIIGGFDRCSICTEEPEEGATMVRILDCHHAFCQPCIDEWLVGQAKDHCPVCREVVFY